MVPIANLLDAVGLGCDGCTRMGDAAGRTRGTPTVPDVTLRTMGPSGAAVVLTLRPWLSSGPVSGRAL